MEAEEIVNDKIIKCISDKIHNKLQKINFKIMILYFLFAIILC